MQEFLSTSTDETREIAFEFVESLKPIEGRALVIGLYGDLGAGKTTFMRYFAEALEIKENIQSPTFVIMKKFPLPESKFFSFLIHIDAYRVEKEEEMKVLGFEEIIKDSQNIVCIEWPEKILGVMGEHSKIFFEHVGGENERKIRFE